MNQCTAYTARNAYISDGLAFDDGLSGHMMHGLGVLTE